MKKILALLLVLVFAVPALAMPANTPKLTVDIPLHWTYKIDKDYDIEIRRIAGKESVTIMAVPYEGEDIEDFAEEIADGFDDADEILRVSRGVYQFLAWENGAQFEVIVARERRWILTILIAGDPKSEDRDKILNSIQVK